MLLQAQSERSSPQLFLHPKQQPLYVLIAEPVLLLLRLLPPLVRDLQAFEALGFDAFAQRFAQRDALSGQTVINGAILLEQLFLYPGIGLLLITSVRQLDINTAQAIVLITAVPAEYAGLLK